MKIFTYRAVLASSMLACSILALPVAAQAGDWDLSGAFSSDSDFVSSGSGTSTSRTIANTLPTIAGATDNSTARSVLREMGSYAKIIANSEDKQSTGVVSCRDSDQLGDISKQNAAKYQLPNVKQGF
ncbi:hypothetical protein ACM7LV_27100 [Pseudomonas aeruginosa]|uniref:Uncharacterized protein n=1 Tax=Pseudomonas aeruginosa TaxID=287 RepID=A0A9P1RB36_PSEAI|nr:MULTISPECIES: hypothetical protein [Pseudomonas]KFF32357.1 hypothetical protein G039_0332645 [Pseudomonas aeruginosa VRFPA01]SCZ06936.1 Uncharacterised protein [Acinetobacter baumannii]EKV3606873.1 hypothetical protein [Pseudomonas aeruginosa]EKW6796058.1 hypothetical protein [Pseudomonas aeruginosa]EKX7258122.1 hypothetical protein [Pseudomonas aeruginosa]